MKKIVCLIAAFLLMLSVSVTMIGCKEETPSSPSSGTETPGDNTGGDNSGDNEKPELKNITGVTFADATFTYDGLEREITVSGTLPQGANTVYTQNKATDAGVYNASAKITCTGYNDLTLTATLTINKAAMTGIAFEGKTVHGDGELKTIEPSGNIPQGAEITVTYDGNKVNGVKDAGAYSVKLTVAHKNYETFEKTVTLRILTVSDIAKTVIDGLLGDKPDPWDFMPDGLKEENMAYTAMPVTDFTDFVQVSTIGKRVIGKQLNVLYDGLNDASTLLGYVDNVYSIGTTIANLYQTYINANPDDYAEFKGEAAGFKILIKLDGDDSILLAGNSAVSVELYYYGSTGKRTGRVQLSDGMALKYESTADELKFAVKKTVKGVGQTQQIEFARDDNAVAGLMYEYAGTENNSIIKTTAEILFDENYARIVSDKRESDDLKINGYEEVYDSQTGEFIGGEVAETVKSIDYDTLWFMLGNVSGFNSVKVIDEANGTNADTIYLNGASEAMHTKLVGGISLKTASRRYDVEMKDVYYIVKKVENDKTTYEKIKTQIPMVFVQIEHTDTFGADVKEKNPNEFPTAPVLPQDKQATITAVFEQLRTLFLEAKEKGSSQMIVDYIGEKSPLFQKVEQQ